MLLITNYFLQMHKRDFSVTLQKQNTSLGCQIFLHICISVFLFFQSKDFMLQWHDGNVTHTLTSGQKHSEYKKEQPRLFFSKDKL